MSNVSTKNLLLERITKEQNLEVVKEYLSFVKTEIRRIYESGKDAFELTQKHTELIDSLLESLVVRALTDSAPLQSSFALIAVGGYGRRELNPASDVDIIFLVDSDNTSGVNEMILKTTYPLWDSGLDMSYSVRSISDCLNLAMSNDAVLTSLLDARFITGDRNKFNDFEKAMRELLFNNFSPVFERIVKMVEVRHAKSQHPGRFLEPNVKEAEGGLRDYHTIRWLLAIRKGVKDIDELYKGKIISESTFRRFMEAVKFLLSVRNELHFHFMRKQDDLDFESQKRIAVKMGYQDTRNELGVEKFMRTFYINTQIVKGVLEEVLEKVFHYTHCQVNVLTKPIDIEPPFVIDGNCISVLKRGVFKNLKNVLKYFSLIAKTGLRGDGGVRKMLTTGIKNFNKNTLKKSDSAGLFWSLFNEPFVYEAIYEMYKSGLLFRIIPEFKKIFFKIQYDVYHVYPVDLHSLYAVRELDRLRRGEYAQEHPLLSFLIKELKDISILYLSVLLHDIGKGYGKNHAKRGAIIAEKIVKRLKGDEERIKRCTFLVENHLMMSEIAQRRDLGDLKHVFDFSQLVGDRENLKYLYILTFADLKAVSPGALTHWKSSLLQELYIKTEEFLEKGKISEGILRDKVEKIRHMVMSELIKRYNRDEIEAFLEVFPLRDLLSNSFEDIIRYFEILKILEREKYYIAREDFPDKKYSKIIFAAVDVPGIFSKITGVLSSNNINILSAQINTMRNGKILDVFYVNDIVGEAITDSDRWSNTLKDLADVMENRVEVSDLVKHRFKPSIIKTKKRRELPVRVIIDNNSSDLYTLIEVYANDRPGLLYRITSTLSRLSLNICRAKISTKVDQVADVFYVTDLQGQKILGRDEIRKIRENLKSSIEN